MAKNKANALAALQGGAPVTNNPPTEPTTGGTAQPTETPTPEEKTPAADSGTIETKAPKNDIFAILTKLADNVDVIAKKVETLDSKVADLSEVKTIAPVARTTAGVKMDEGVQEAPSEYKSIVERVLGMGWETFTEPISKDAFRLILIPPMHLREFPDTMNDKGEAVVNDKRVRVITNVQGSAGVQDYCELVKKFTRDWCFKNGVNYSE